MLIVGGSCTSTIALADIYMLNTVTWSLKKVCVIVLWSFFLPLLHVSMN